MASCKSDGVGFEGLQVSTRTHKAVQNVKKISHSHSCAAHAWQADFKYLSLQLADMGGGGAGRMKGEENEQKPLIAQVCCLDYFCSSSAAGSTFSVFRPDNE